MLTTDHTRCSDCINQPGCTERGVCSLELDAAARRHLAQAQPFPPARHYTAGAIIPEQSDKQPGE